MPRSKNGARKLKCPECQGRTEVRDSRVSKDEDTIWRRRHCENGHRFSTLEVITTKELGDHEAHGQGVLAALAKRELAALLLRLAANIQAGKTEL